MDDQMTLELAEGLQASAGRLLEVAAMAREEGDLVGCARAAGVAEGLNLAVISLRMQVTNAPLPGRLEELLADVRRSQLRLVVA